jgi:MFS family permease
MPQADTSAHHTQRPGRSPLGLVGILSEGFFSHLSSGVVAFALPLYARQLGLSIAEIGFLLSLHLSVSLALKPFMSWVGDRMGYRRGATIAIVLRSLFFCLLAGAGAPWHLYVLQAGRGLAKSVRDPSMHALIAVRGGKKRLASTFAWYQTADGTAAPIGRVLAGVLLTATAAHFQWVFGLAAVLSVLPVAALYLSLRRSHGVQEQIHSAQEWATSQPTTPQPHAPNDDPRHWMHFLPFVGFGFLISAIAHMLHGLMPLLLVEYAGLSEAQAGLLYLVSTVVMLVFTPIFGWIYDHGNRTLVLMMRSMANVTSSVIYLLAPTFAGLACAKAFDKVGTAAFRPAWATMMAEVSATDQSKRAQRIGLMSAGNDAGSAAGPILAGVLWSTWGVAALMGTRIALAVIAELYTVLLTRSMAQSSRAQANPEPRSSPSQVVV